MDADYLAVPMWLVKFAVLGGLGIGVKALLELRSIRQLLIGYDGKNGILGDLELLDAKVENVERDITDLRIQGVAQEGKIERLEEELDRHRGKAA
jgi:hypothetical protein